MGKGVIRAGKGFTLLISNEDIDDITKIIGSTENSDLLTDDTTETVKHEIKKQEGGLLGASLIALTASPLAQPMASSLIHAITGKGAMRAGKGYNNMDHIDKHF